MDSSAADLWIFLGAAVLAVAMGAWAWISSDRAGARLARTLAENLGGSVQGTACTIDYQGISLRIRQVRERLLRHRYRDLLQLELDIACPTRFSIVESDPVLGGVAGVLATDGADTSLTDWELSGFQMSTTSRAWASSWLSEVREALQRLSGQSITLLRLTPQGIECRRLLDERAHHAPADSIRDLLEPLHTIVTSAAKHRPDLVGRDDDTGAFEDTRGPLTLQFALLAIAALGFLPAIAMTHNCPPLPWGVELELSAAAVLMVVGLALYHPRIRAHARRRENPSAMYLSAMVLMGTALCLIGAGISRPVACWVMGDG